MDREYEKMKQAADRIVRKPELFQKIGFSDAIIWQWERDGKFPRRIQLGGNSVAWLESEIDLWIRERAAERVIN